jgi:hypothetical protein
MIVDELRVDEAARGNRVRSARVRWTDGEARLRLEAPAELLAEAEDASPYLAAALQLAMRRGEDLEIDGPVSPLLLARAEAIQSIYASWNPGLRRARVRVAAEREPASGADLSACFFSRGVDSTYSVIAERPRDEALDRLVYDDGLEIWHDEQVSAEELRLAVEAARVIGMPLFVVRSNVRELSEPLCDWIDMVGAGLAFVALSLAGGLARMVIPSTDSPVTLMPCGTSPVLDPLFSTETVRLEHDRIEHTRSQKVARIVDRRPDLVPYLKVCIAENRPDNCGRCGKCVLTMAALQADGALEHAAGFPDRIDPAAVDALYLHATDFLSRYEWAELCRMLPTDGELGEIRSRVIARLADRGVWVDPYTRKPEYNFRFLHALTYIALAHEGRPNPPPADVEAGVPQSPGWSGSLGLVRTLDPVGARHLYGVGTVPPGRLVGELGSLADQPAPGRIPAWLTQRGYLVTETYRPDIGRAEPKLLARWTLAPLSWRGFDTPTSRARTALWRMRRLLAHRTAEISHAGGEPTGYLYADPDAVYVDPHAERRPLYSAIHPVTGDQLLSSSEWEASDMGYTGVALLGFLDAVAPITGRLGTDRPVLPWASRLGQTARQ